MNIHQHRAYKAHLIAAAITAVWRAQPHPAAESAVAPSIRRAA
ncbi:MAG: hypothetical protein ACR2GH_11405 [Pseudonocardia sp.]